MTRCVLFLLILGVSASASSQVVINEVLYDPNGTDTGSEKIEITNLGSSPVDLTSYDLFPGGIGYFTFPSFTLNPGSIVVLHLRQSGTNTASDLYHSSPISNMGNTAGSIALFNSTTHNSATLVSFVQWGGANQTWAATAFSAGCWESAAEFVAAAPEGHSIEYDGSGIVPTDWFDQSAPTIGLGNALPVEFSTFRAEVHGWNAELRWKTESEVENYGFEIQRRGIGATGQGGKGAGVQGSNGASENSIIPSFQYSSWEVVGFIQGSGTSTSPREYSFLDRNLSSGRYAYRIKQIDHGGSFTYTFALEVEVGLAPRQFSLSQNYPNPFNPTTTIEFTLPEDGRIVLKIYDLLGKEVGVLVEGEREAGIVHRVLFEASRLASGMYFMRLEFKGGTLTKKILLVK